LAPRTLQRPHPFFKYFRWTVRLTYLESEDVTINSCLERYLTVLLCDEAIFPGWGGMVGPRPTLGSTRHYSNDPATVTSHPVRYAVTSFSKDGRSRQKRSRTPSSASSSDYGSDNPAHNRTNIIPPMYTPLPLDPLYRWHSPKKHPPTTKWLKRRAQTYKREGSQRSFSTQVWARVGR
jgi:hypothetical protein